MKKTIGERIRERREKLSLTQRQLCAAAGISVGFLSDVENGKRGLSAANLGEVARALDASCDWLIWGKKP
jgi:transcriptional regulator with XRE-family HTH domain